MVNGKQFSFITAAEMGALFGFTKYELAPKSRAYKQFRVKQINTRSAAHKFTFRKKSCFMNCKARSESFNHKYNPESKYYKAGKQWRQMAQTLTCHPAPDKCTAARLRCWEHCRGRIVVFTEGLVPNNTSKPTHL